MFPIVLDPIFASMLRSDQFYANIDCTKFSITKLDESYRKFSEQIQTIYPGYGVDTKLLIYNKEEDYVDLDELKNFFLSKDLDRYEELKSKFIGTQTKFLQPKQQPIISYTSYPRSGNTFLRKYFESITGISTGSDMVMKFSLNVALQFTGFKGEGIVDDRVWINKTHFPYRLPYDHSYESHLVLCCVRNPLDVFVSQFLQLCTMSHNKDVNEDITQFEEWKLHIKQEVNIWRKWHDYWVEKARKKEVPVFFFRFEDLIRDPQTVLNDIFAFTLGTPDIKGTNIERRILDTLKTGAEGNTLYKPRQGGVNKNRDKYSEEQMKLIMETLEEPLNFWGYTRVPGQPNDFGFFDYGPDADEGLAEKYMGFKQLNDEMWRFVLDEKEKAKGCKMTINKGSEGFSMFKEKQLPKFLPLPMKTTIKESKTIL